MRDKNKKALLIIVLLLVICFGFRLIANKVLESKPDDEEIATEEVTPVIKVEPQVIEDTIKDDIMLVQKRRGENKRCMNL